MIKGERYMEKKEFQAESKRLLDLMIHSIYSQKEVFLRELISNASVAIDKIYYKTLTDDSLVFQREDYFIKIDEDNESKTLTVEDTRIGMTMDEHESHSRTMYRLCSIVFT